LGRLSLKSFKTGFKQGKRIQKSFLRVLYPLFFMIPLQS
jgi:hypothetical protein